MGYYYAYIHQNKPAGEQQNPFMSVNKHEHHNPLIA